MEVIMTYHASPLLLLLGFCIGITSGFYGVGGGWLSTPILNILGLPMPYAIGTSLVYIISNSILGTFMHNKLKNVKYVLGLTIGFSSILGVFMGKTFISYIGKSANADILLRYIYIVFLFAMSSYILFEKKFKFLPKSKKKKSLSPLLHIKITDNSTLKISFWKLFFIGMLVGLVSSIMGIGGGFLLVPVLIYIIRIPVKLAVGTNLVAILVTGISGGTLYMLDKKVDYLSVVYLVLGTIIGVTLGVSATKHVDSEKLKFLFGLTVLSAGISVIFKQLQFDIISKYFILFIALFSAFIIIYMAYINRLSKNKNL